MSFYVRVQLFFIYMAQRNIDGLIINGIQCFSCLKLLVLNIRACINWSIDRICIYYFDHGLIESVNFQPGSSLSNGRICLSYTTVFN